MFFSNLVHQRFTEGGVEDFVSGTLSTGLNALGAGEIAGVLRLGEKVALQAGERVAARGGTLLAYA